MAYRSGSGTNISMFLQVGGGGGTIGGTYEGSFQSGSMVGSNFIVNHNLGTYPSGVIVYDESGEKVEPDSVTNPSTMQTVISLQSYAPISGNWRVSVTA